MVDRRFVTQCTLPVLLLLTAASSSATQSSSPEDKLKDIHAYRRISDRLATSGQMDYDRIKDIKDAGFDVVINLAIADEKRNASEGYLVTGQGMAYFHIPVSFQQPSLNDLDLFFHVMDAVKDKKVYVHCFANMRVSVFVYLYRTMHLGEAEEAALQDLRAIWDPSTDENWAKFIEAARARKD